LFPEGCIMDGGKSFLKIVKNLGRTPFEHCGLKQQCPVRGVCQEKSSVWRQN
jgi:hypothetical protein